MFINWTKKLENLTKNFRNNFIYSVDANSDGQAIIRITKDLCFENNYDSSRISAKYNLILLYEYLE